MLCELQSRSPHRFKLYWCFGFAWKFFLSTIFHIIKVHPWNVIAWILVIISFFCYWHYNHVLIIRIHDVNALDLEEKAFLSTIFLIIKVCPWNKTNLGTNNNLYYFCYGYYNHVLLFGIGDIALDLEKKLFFPPNETNLDTHNNLYYFCYGN